jgi:cofilin
LKKKYNYIIFTLNKESTEIVVDNAGTVSDYHEFLEKLLPEAECRWAIYDFEFEKEGAGRRNKITFVSW